VSATSVADTSAKGSAPVNITRKGR
jgi:hypothetical protein